MIARDFNYGALTYLIQHTKTRAYFQKGTWTPESSWAEEFSDLGKAIDMCLREEMRDVELVLLFGLEDGRTYRLQLSLPDEMWFACDQISQRNSASRRRSASSLGIW